MGKPGGPAQHPAGYYANPKGCGRSVFGTMVLMLALAMFVFRRK